MSRPRSSAALRRREKTAGERLKLAYRRFWEAKATEEDQRLVLADIAAFCGWNKDPYQKGDRDDQNYCLGMRRVWLRIEAMAGVVSPLGRATGEIGDEPDDRSGQTRLTGEGE